MGCGSTQSSVLLPHSLYVRPCMSVILRRSEISDCFLLFVVSGCAVTGAREGVCMKGSQSLCGFNVWSC